jgi:hypothetical protein
MARSLLKRPWRALGVILATMQVLHKTAFVHQVGAAKAGHVVFRISWV